MNKFAKKSLSADHVARPAAVFLLVSTVFVIASCSTNGKNGSNGRKSDPHSVSKDVQSEMASRLRKAFDEMKTAVQNGDLKTLQKMWVSPTGDTYSMETLSKTYSQRGEEMAGAIREARIVSLGIDISVPSKSIKERHPNAKYAGTMPVRNSYGDPRLMRAILIDGSWRFIYRINSQDNSSNNGSEE